ncbi:Protein of unknown function, DUF608 [Cnuella takakiae]|uniref:Glycosyl-hydrolase family 116 catalytic region domain-containing protein n=1 Tax=Cnuella takakiae TaxID=1302690 RepID=A0A1M5G6U1_9BACT|nr:DUF4450 domain-containing protein [Cnuella takakiae]SHF99408.1 Protein of unknown function, DUF608 [Cnuella takakiae]
MINYRIAFPKIAAASLLLLSAFASKAQEAYPIQLSSKTWHDQQLELRYKPDGQDFVITNGNRQFTRALYGTHTAFRVETGDRPEFAFYMPGMGGNLKFGIGVGGKTKWLTEADTIIARYRPGARLYTIKDRLLGKGSLQLTILALADAEGCIIQTHFTNLHEPAEFFWAFGGATGKKFSRDGDMGPDPESSFYLKPENCKDNKFTIREGSFHLSYGTGLVSGPDGRYFVEDAKQPAKPAKEQFLEGVFAPASELKLSDAKHLAAPANLWQSTSENAPVLAGKLKAANKSTHYFSIYNPATRQPLLYKDLASVFTRAEFVRKELASRIKVNTPDPFINTIGGALAVASDAIWDAPTYMHGSIGWRMRLPGWRGAYTADVLGWHDRAKTHLGAYAQSQFTSPPSGPILPDTAMHLARSTEKTGIGMFTSGYINRDPNGANPRPHHYDMNLVFIDQLFRHFAWTGDTAFMRQTWPVIKRHLDWETRNFDVDSNGLYDAYAAIWASDALQYSGGDVTHTSAYNYLGFKQAAKIATLLGEDPTPYQRQAEKILKAMNQVLWLPEKGRFAEFQDRLGNRLLHPAPGIWTIYHSIDSEVPTPFQAYQQLRYVDKEIPHIPIRAKGLDDGGYYTIATTSWMPYMWSLNNVAIAESMHLALANWQAGRTDEAFKLFKSEVLQSMYLGGSPGNIVQISRFDAARGEAYRDFADPVGMFSRALVEGLFGIVPNALDNTLTIRPGIPAAWNFASFSTPDIAFDFKRRGNRDQYTIQPALPFEPSLVLQVKAQRQVQQVLVNGRPANWKNLADAVGKLQIQVQAPYANRYDITIVWQGAKPASSTKEQTYVQGQVLKQAFSEARVLQVYDPQGALGNTEVRSSGFSAAIKGATGNYTVFAQISQGQLSWWLPICFIISTPWQLLAVNGQEENSPAFRLQNNIGVATTAQVSVNTFRTEVQVEAGKVSDIITVPEGALLPGTNKVIITTAPGKVQTLHWIYWKGRFSGKQEPVDLGAHFNDRVRQIFKNKYLSPRPLATTLQLPWQGIGDWPHPHESFEVADSGLRKLAGPAGEILLPQGIRFRTPGQAGVNNILFTSQWDNYPKEQTIPLSGRATHAWLLMAGSTNPMQSQLANGIVEVHYTDGTKDSLVLRNPETWWPIEQDYYTDGFAFRLKQARPIRVHLATGNVVDGKTSKAQYNGQKIPGGAATVLDLPLDGTKILQSLTLKTVANDVVIGLMAVTLNRVD